MTMIYTEDSGDLLHLTGKRVGVVGYGAMGQAFALNMRDQGVSITVYPQTPAETEITQQHGLTYVQNGRELMQQTQILVLTVGDETLPVMYMEQISPHLQRGYSLIFTSAYSVAFGYIEPPPFVDVGLVAPRQNGYTVRESFVSGARIPSFVAVGQDASRHAWEIVLAIARASGGLSGGGVEVTFEQEAALSLFVQQAVIPTFHHLMVTAATLLMRSGYPAEAALTDLYLSGKFNDYMAQIAQEGLLPTLQKSNQTGQYATLSRLSRFSDLKLERLMEMTLEEIRKGDFAREWTREYADGCPRLNRMLKAQESIDVWEMEQQTFELRGDR